MILFIQHFFLGGGNISLPFPPPPLPLLLPLLYFSLGVKAGPLPRFTSPFPLSQKSTGLPLRSVSLRQGRDARSRNSVTRESARCRCRREGARGTEILNSGEPLLCGTIEA